MNVTKLNEHVSYYTDLTPTFEAERHMMRDAGIHSVRGLLEAMEGTEADWSLKNGSPKGIHDNDYDANSLVYAEKKFDIKRLSPFDKIINECVSQYKEDHGISDKTEVVSSNVILKYLKGNNFSGINIEKQDTDKHIVIFYLNDDYVGGQVSFSKNNDKVNTLVHPKYPENINAVDLWLKPRHFSILIFPASSMSLYNEHVLSSWDKYTIQASF